ncbi:MAG: methanogenesis marker 15 protein [Methanotrichaceae archaeon]|nr:methanogenesis marker 15 protein [Methanotrichaceae archaeon]
MIRIAELACGPEYSGIQKEIERAAEKVGAKIVYPEVSLEDILNVEKKFGVKVASGDLNLAMARAVRIIENPDLADAVIVMTCFRCAEAAIIRSEIRKFIHEKSRLPVLSYSFTERTTAETLFTRMEALVTTVKFRGLLARESQKGLTAGIDSGSTTTKSVVMKNNQVIGTGWVPTIEVIQSAEDAYDAALSAAGVNRADIQGLGVTGYGRFLVGKHFDAKLVQEEITVNAKGAVFLANAQKGSATVIDIGGMDNKAIAVHDGIPGGFTMGGICAGASGRFLELTARRLGIDITDLGKLALKGNYENVSMNSYCIVFGTQSLVNSLSMGCKPEDVAMAACHSVAEQVYEQQLQEVEVKEPVIMVGGTSLIEGLPKAMESLLNINVIVPRYAQFVGAVGASLLVSGLLEG